MPRYTSILDGTEFTNSSLAEGGYDYYMFTRPGGSGVIMRLNTAGTEAKFYRFGSTASTAGERISVISAIWADRVNKNYVVAGGFNSF